MLGVNPNIVLQLSAPSPAPEQTQAPGIEEEDEHQPEEITRGPLMGGVASIDVDAWWDRRALITSARTPAGTLPRAGGGQSRG